MVKNNFTADRGQLLGLGWIEDLLLLVVDQKIALDIDKVLGYVADFVNQTIKPAGEISQKADNHEEVADGDVVKR